MHATHTHSGPGVRVPSRGAWEPPWQALLPRRIARACLQAVQSLRDAELRHARVPCEGMGTNRVYDKFDYGEEALAEGFRPAKPEMTDTACHVLKAVAAGGEIFGFLSYFGCHNVVGGKDCTYLHGDYAGIATNMIEREHPGSIGLFLQGAQGDVNTAICCLGNDKVLGALDIMAARYARAVRRGLQEAVPVAVDQVRYARRLLRCSRRAVPLSELRQRLSQEVAVLDDPQVDDASPAFRFAVLHSRALEAIIARVEAGEFFENEAELQGLRVGPIAFLGTPYEVFQAIKNDVVAQAKAPIPLVMSQTNDAQGYAVDRRAAADEKDYAARVVPLWSHTMPFANIHDELASALLSLDAGLAELSGGQ